MNPLAWLEADMARHMLVEFPLLAALGAWLACHTPPRVESVIARFDRYGLTGWTYASLAAAFWMIPAALDAALSSPSVNASKYASLIAAGFALRGAMRRSPTALEAFFVGNFVWMSATVGLIYQDSPQRLCLSYLMDAQARAGRGLVAAAVVIGVAWSWRALRGSPLRAEARDVHP